jgi:hypothetical protein
VALKATLASPSLTGVPVAPTAAGNTTTTQLATTAFVQQELTTLIGGAPSTLNDLNELANAINDDANYNTTLTSALATKLPLAGGAMTGAITTNSTFDGRDVAADGVTADAALPKAGGTMTGTLAMGANAITSTGTISSGAITSTGILTLDTSPAANGTGDLKVIPSANSTAGVGFAGQVLGVNISSTLSSNSPKQAGTWGGVTGSTAIALQADDNSYGQFQVWTAPQNSSANTVLTPRFWIKGNGEATFAGNVGIGETSPANLLHVKASDTGIAPHSSAQIVLEREGTNYLQFLTAEAGTSGILFGDGSDVDASKISVDHNTTKMTFTNETVDTMTLNGAKVGIGISTPDLSLHVNGANGLPATSGSTPVGMLSLRAKTANASHGLHMGVSGNAPWGSWLQAQDANNLATEYPLLLNPNGGNVGIGTASPGGKLHVQMAHTATDVTLANSNETLVLGNSGTGNGVYNAIKFGGNQQDMYIMSFNHNTAASRRMGFFLGSVAGDAVTDERLSILGNGNVGIGTPTPASLLDVGGGLIADPAIRIDSASGGSPYLIFDASQANRSAHIKFYDNGSAVGGFIDYLHNGDKMNFGSGSSSNVTLSVGDNKIGIGLSDPRNDMWMTSATSNTTDRWGFGGGSGGTSKVWYTINQNNAGVYIGFGNTSWTAHSDERIKENIVSLGTVLPDLMNMRCVKYNRFGDDGADRTKIGFIAQDWETNFPEIIDEMSGLVIESDGTLSMAESSDSTTIAKGLSYTETIPVLLKAIQELEARIRALES